MNGSVHAGQRTGRSASSKTRPRKKSSKDPIPAVQRLASAVTDDDANAGPTIGNAPADGHIEVNNQHNSHHGVSSHHPHPNHAQNMIFQEVESMFPPEEHGQYERLRKLGSGAFGAVVLVKDMRNNRLYAMKVLTITDDKDGRRNIQEVKLLKMMQHPTIVQLHDVFLTTDRKLLCLVMTYCDSGDLAQQISEAKQKRRPIPEKTLLSWFAQVFLGIHYLHEHHLLHRDLKPQNLFLTEYKELIKIGDLGLAKVLTGDDFEVTECGTPYYTAPEMINNQPYSLPSDVWSLGVCLYECMATHLPFKGDTDLDLVKGITCEDPAPLPDHYSHDIRGMVRWMLQKTPDRRPTVSQLLATPLVVKHMAQFIKDYRPMHTEERQRRAQIKNMNQQAQTITSANKAITIQELDEILAQPDPEKVKAEQQIALEKEKEKDMDGTNTTEADDVTSAQRKQSELMDGSHGEKKTMSMSMPAMAMPSNLTGPSSGAAMSWMSMPNNGMMSFNMNMGESSPTGWECGVQLVGSDNQNESFNDESVTSVTEDNLGLASPNEEDREERKMERRKSSLAICEVAQPITLTLGLAEMGKSNAEPCRTPIHSNLLTPKEAQDEDSDNSSGSHHRKPCMLKDTKESYITASLSHNRMMQDIDDANHMEEILNQFDQITRKSVDHKKGHLRSHSENLTEIAKELNEHALGSARDDVERHKSLLRQSAEDLNVIMETVNEKLRSSCSSESFAGSRVSSRLQEALEYGQDLELASSADFHSERNQPG